MALETDSLIVGAASAFALVVVGFAAALPKIMASIKRDGLDGNFAAAQQKLLADMQELFAKQIAEVKENASEQMAELKKANSELREQVNEMHSLIDKYRIQLTKTKNLLVDFESLLEKAGVVVPAETKIKFDKLVEEVDNENQEAHH